MMQKVILLIMCISLLLVSCVRENNMVVQQEITDDDLQMRIVSKTEYVPNDAGQVIVELRNKNYEPITADCFASSLYPNKTYLFQDEPMQVTILGTQFVNFTVPFIDGVFEYSVNCSVGGKIYIASSSFHVSKGRMRAWIEK